MRPFTLVTLTALATLAYSTSTFAYDSYNSDNYDQSAQAAVELPMAQHEMGINYVTGGIGDEERMAMEDMRHNYNLRITNVNAEGAFAGDAELMIYDSKGTQLSTVNAGPLFYAEVPPGKYTIVAKNDDGLEKKKSIRVSKNKASEVALVW